MVAETALPPSERSALSREQRLWQWRVLISTYMAYAGYYLCRKVFSLCKTTLLDHFNKGMASAEQLASANDLLEMNDIAHLWTAYLFAYMVGQFLNSYLGRKSGPRVLLLGGLGLSIAFNTVFGFANSYRTFLVFMFFNGLAQASGWPGCVGGISEWLRRHERGTIMGFWSTNYLIGNMLVKSIGGFLLAAYGWRYAFFGCSLLTVAIWWVIYFWQRNKPEDVGLPPIVWKEAAEDRAVKASTEQRISFKEYLVLAFNPIVVTMGLSYFSVKFLRYALDSWLPTFLNLQGFDVGRAAYYSQVFDFAGLAGAILAGWALDRWFRGRWAHLCFLMGIGAVVGYVAVVMFGNNPYALSFSFGIVGFMIYGPDTLLAGAAAVQVAGARNGVAVAGLVNGLASIGPVIQEEVIGALMKGRDPQAAIDNVNLLTLGMSVLFVLTMLIVMAYMRAARRRNEAQVT